jgi:hypothetical protein
MFTTGLTTKILKRRLRCAIELLNSGRPRHDPDVREKSDDAIAIFESARTIVESLYKAGATDKLSTVATCDVKMGQVAAQAGHQQAAAEYFHRAEPLMSSATANLDALYAAADAYSGLGELSMRKAQRTGQAAQRRKANWIEARSSYLPSLNTWHRIEHPNHTAPHSFGLVTLRWSPKNSS